MTARQLRSIPRRVRGFTLVELMVALVLGMIVTGAALAMFLTNQRVYASTENLGRVQESVRTAYEMMSRDIRESAGNTCEADIPLVNVLNSPASRWWTTMDGAVKGYDGATAFGDEAFGTATGIRLSGTDAIELKSAVADGTSVNSHNGTSSFTLNNASHGLAVGDIVMVCDFNQAAVLQINSVSGANIGYGTSGTPGNCTTGLQWSSPTNCASAGTYTYLLNSSMSRVRMERWFIANNGRGGRSLYQAALVNTAGVLSVTKQEIADGVLGMQVQYLIDGATDYVSAGSVTAAQWSGTDVLALRITLTMQGINANGQVADAVPRTLEHTVTLRNRVP